MKIIPLSEGAFTVDKTKVFVPFNTLTDNLQERPVGSMLVEIQPFVVITANDILLLDTGLGFKNDEGVLQIHQNLIDNGIGPMEVTKVLISHLHKDHSGGVTIKDDQLNQSFLSFPNATYYVNKQELEYALDKGNPTYKTEDFEILDSSDKVVLLDDKQVIDGYIKHELTGAHCPYHATFMIEEDGQKVFFGADVAPQLQQMKSRFVAKYDYDGRKCMELRQQWWKQGQEESWTFLFYHDVKTPVVTP